jgi:hypothetical protein
MEDHMATDSLAQPKEHLDDLFQLGSADLDFGNYWMMKRKRARVRYFFDTRLVQIVDDALSADVAAKQAALANMLEEVAEQIRQDLAADNISADGDVKTAPSEPNLGRG